MNFDYISEMISDAMFILADELELAMDWIAFEQDMESNPYGDAMPSDEDLDDMEARMPF